MLRRLYLTAASATSPASSITLCAILRMLAGEQTRRARMAVERDRFECCIKIANLLASMAISPRRCEIDGRDADVLRPCDIKCECASCRSTGRAGASSRSSTEFFANLEVIAHLHSRCGSAECWKEPARTDRFPSRRRPALRTAFLSLAPPQTIIIAWSALLLRLPIAQYMARCWSISRILFWLADSVTGRRPGHIEPTWQRVQAYRDARSPHRARRCTPVRPPGSPRRPSKRHSSAQA